MGNVAPPRRLRQPWDASMWSVVIVVPLAVVLAMAISARAGALTLAGYLAAAACYRGLARGHKPAAFSVRSRWLDVTLLAGAAIVLLVLGLLAPGR